MTPKSQTSTLGGNDTQQQVRPPTSTTSSTSAGHGSNDESSSGGVQLLPVGGGGDGYEAGRTVPLSPTVNRVKELKLANALHSVNKLQFHSIGLVGREKEQQLLNECLERLVVNNHNHEYQRQQQEQQQQEQKQKNSRHLELVLISGTSGVGKTSLAYSLKDVVVSKKYKGTFVSAKYDATFKDNQPFSGIGATCNELCKEILKRSRSQCTTTTTTTMATTPKPPQNNSNGNNTTITCGDDDDGVGDDVNPFLASVRKEIFENIDKSQIELLETIAPLLHMVAYGTSTTTNSNNINNDNNSHDNNNIQEGDSYTKEEVTTTAAVNTNRKPRREQQKQQSRRTLRRIPRRSVKKEDKNSEVRSIDTLSTGAAGRSSTGMDAKSAKEVLVMALRRLFRILTSRLDLVTVLLDDLQWADAPSLEMVEEILQDQDITNLLLIGSFRSDEVQEHHVCAKMIRNLKMKAGDGGGGFNMNEISVANLSLESVGTYINELLSISDPAKTTQLSSICHRRTLGNVFYIQVFLNSLRDSSLLQFNTGSFQWVWDEGNIEAETAATDNLISLLKSKMNKFRDDFLLLLKIASCLGNTFDRHVLQLLWEKCEKAPTDKLDSLIEIAVEEMFFEKSVNNSDMSTSSSELMLSSTSYRFVHDKVQEAASSLIPLEEYEIFRTKVGTCLYQELEEDDFDRMIFVVTDLLNTREGVHNDDDNGLRTELASLNLKAAVKSMDLSAFVNAARYVEMGLKHMNPSTLWEDHFILALQFHTIGAEAEAYIGNSAMADRYCTEVKRQPKATPYDKLRVYKILIDQLHGSGKFDESWTASLDLFQELGFTIPKNKSMQRMKANAYLRETKNQYLPTIEQIDSMGYLSDHNIKETMAFFMQAAAKTVMAGETSAYVLLTSKCIRLTKKHGLSEFSGSAFASFANVLMHIFGDWATAIKVAEAALAIQSRLNSNYTLASTIYKTNRFVLGWTKPLKGCWNSFMEAYRLGMLSGNIEASTCAIWNAIMSQFYSGSTLQCVLDDLKIYLAQMNALKNKHMGSQMRTLMQLVLNLIGDDESNPNTTLMQGSAFDEVNDTLPKINYLKTWICYACIHFGEYEKGADVALEVGDSFYRTVQGGAVFGFESFPRALCLYAHARRTRQKKFIKAARDVRQNLNSWVKKGGINLLHQLLILDAEEAAYRGNVEHAKSNYTKALTTASRGGFLQDAGLANERYASYLLAIDPNSSDATYHYNESIRYYSEWGSNRRVAMLQEKISQQ